MELKNRILSNFYKHNAKFMIIVWFLILILNIQSSIKDPSYVSGMLTGGAIGVLIWMIVIDPYKIKSIKLWKDHSQWLTRHHIMVMKEHDEILTRLIKSKGGKKYGNKKQIRNNKRSRRKKS